MKTPAKAKGTWLNRFMIRFLTLLLGVLFYWLLGFIIEDVGQIPGPDYEKIVTKSVDPDLREQSKKILSKKSTKESQKIGLEENQKILEANSKTLEQTISQLMTLQRFSNDRSSQFSEKDQAQLFENLKRLPNVQQQFFDNQTARLNNNTEIQKINVELRTLERGYTEVQNKINDQEKVAKKRYYQLVQEHNMQIAIYKILVILPFLVLSSYFVMRRRESLYFPLAFSVVGASLVRTILIIHEYFPKKSFKYFILCALILAIVRILIYFIHVIAHPKIVWLVKQYREAYERFLCPVCEYPIRVGPRRFLFWTRRSIQKMPLPNGEGAYTEEPYVCPNCGTSLFETCPSCHKVRHSLLPHCRHCGAERTPE